MIFTVSMLCKRELNLLEAHYHMTDEGPWFPHISLHTCPDVHETSLCLNLSCNFTPSKVTVSEPEFMDDPAAVATLAVLRSAGGEGTVTLVWQLEDQASDDLSPSNGTLFFTEVKHGKDGVAVPPDTVINFMI